MYTVNCNLEKDRQRILDAIDKILIPIANTMSPYGGNVLLRDNNDKPLITNDGATISRFIQPKDELERLIIDAIIESAEHTNQIAGDGTSTTILLNGTILKSFILGDKNHFQFNKELKEYEQLILGSLEEQRLGGENLEDIRKVAYVSANNDAEIAEIAVDVVDKAGKYGVVKYAFTEEKTYVQSDLGFIIPGAIPHKMFYNHPTHLEQGTTGIFITKSSLFSQEEINIIVSLLVKCGYENIIIVANDFTGKTQELISSIQQDEKNKLSVIPIKIGNKDIIDDLGAYIGIPVYDKGQKKISEESISNSIGQIDSISGTLDLVVINKNEAPESREEHIKYLQSLLSKDKNDESLKQRIASMTSGVITLHIGGATDLEKKDKFLRFQDAIVASTNAIEYGYLPGAGSSMLQAYKQIESTSPLLKEICLANLKQICKNSGVNFESIYEQLDTYGTSYNAKTGQVENMIESGIYDSYRAVELSLKNAVSTSIGLISAMSNTIIIKEDNNK